MHNYSFGKINLKSRDKDLVKKITQSIYRRENIYPVETILAPNKRIVKGLHPNYLSFTSNEFKNDIYELASRLATAAGMEDPIFSCYGDLHSCFVVGWHRDSSGYKYDNPNHAAFFNESKKCLKFYIKMNCSPLDLKIKDNKQQVHRLRSNKSQIAFFDVRNLHHTYITNPFKKSKIIAKILDKILDKFHNLLLIRIHRRIKGFDSISLSNLYFFIYEDCQTWRDYTKREFVRAEAQIKKDKEALNKFYAI